MPAELSRNRRGIRRRSFLINLAILFLVLAAGTAVAVIWGNPIPVQVSATTLGSKIIFGWVAIGVASIGLFPIYLAIQSRAVTTPAQLRQIGLGTIEALNRVQAPQPGLADAVPEMRHMVGVVTDDATHWALVATFEAFSWGFRIRPSRLPMPIKRKIPVLSATWSSIVSVDHIDYPSLIPVFIVNLHDPALSFGLCLPSLFSLAVVDDMVRRGIQMRFTDPTGWPKPRKDL